MLNSALAESYLLESVIEPNQHREVRSVLEVRGELKLNPDGKQVTNVPLNVRGDLHYFVRPLSSDGISDDRREARYYRQADAVFEIDNNESKTSLRSEKQLFVAERTADKVTIFSPLGALARDELDLVAVQGDHLLLERLLPNSQVAVGDSWQHSDQLIASLLGLDAVYKNEVSSKLREVKGTTAVIDLAGTVGGAADGVSSDVELKAVYNFDLQQKRVHWLALSIEENRAIGHAQPGFTVKARLRLATKPAEPVRQLNDHSLASLELESHAGSTLLEFRSEEGGFQFLHDRQWRVMVDRHDVTILRRVENGDLIAQCNASSLPDLKPGHRIELATFQEDVKRAIGESFGSFIESSEGVSESGLRMLRTVVAGSVSDLPIQWTYYHFSDEKGRQMAVVFTLDAQLVERFAENDQGIISSLKLRPRPLPQTVSVETP